MTVPTDSSFIVAKRSGAILAMLLLPVVSIHAGGEAPQEVKQKLVGQSPAQTSIGMNESPEDGLKYVWIPPGSFKMGCSHGDKECYPDEKPSHRVTISKGFWMGQTEVTVSAYKRLVAATSRQMPAASNFNPGWSNGQMPMANVTWDEANTYCEWAGGRLPTEAEWEYAARAGSTEARYEPLDDVAWYNGNGGVGPHEVAQKRPNSFGLYDVLGNVWEWVHDWYDGDYYRSSPERDPQGPTRGQYRILRGGWWLGYSFDVRVSVRDGDVPSLRNFNFGCRCVREAVP